MSRDVEEELDPGSMRCAQRRTHPIEARSLAESSPNASHVCDGRRCADCPPHSRTAASIFIDDFPAFSVNLGPPKTLPYAFEFMQEIRTSTHREQSQNGAHRLPFPIRVAILEGVDTARLCFDGDLIDFSDLLDDLIDEGDLEAAEARLHEMELLGGGTHPLVRSASIRLRWAREGAASIVDELRDLAHQVGDDPDLYHLLGCAYEELDRFHEMVAAFLETLRLDTLADAESLREFPPLLLDAIEARARAVLDGLPAEIGRRLSRVPVILEERPHPALVKEGFDPRALGLFEGPNLVELDIPQPTRIVLYLRNLYDVASSDEELLEEVEITVLHEIGHYLGLDECEVHALGFG